MYFNVSQDVAASYLTSFQSDESIQAAVKVLDAFNFDCRDAFINITVDNAFSKSTAACRDLATNQTIKASGCVGGECLGPLPLPFYYVNETDNAVLREPNMASRDEW